MKAPIIVDERGNLMIFESVKDAEVSLEAVDVRNNEYIAFDSEGRLLRLIPISTHEVSIEHAEAEPSHAQELQAKLVSFLARVEEPETWLKAASLPELIAKALEYKEEMDLSFHLPLVPSLRSFVRRWLSRGTS